MGTNNASSQSKAREKIFWIGTGVTLLVAVVMPLMRQPNAATAASALGSFTFFTVLALYTGQRSLDLELEARYQQLFAALSDNAATDRTKALLREIRERRPPLFHMVAETSLRHLEDQLRGAASGTLAIPDEERLVIPLLLAKNVGTSLDTTAFFANDPTTSEYHAALAEATTARRVKIRRLFIIKPGTESSTAFRQRAVKDLSAGVEVRYRLLDKWVPSSVAREPVDIGIWDGEQVWIYTDNPEIGSERMHPRMIHGEDQVKLYQKTFDQNWEVASLPAKDWGSAP